MTISPKTHLTDALARIWNADCTEPTGTGVLVNATYILTCAHVVNSALGRKKEDKSSPPMDVTVYLDFPVIAGDPQRLRAKVSHWFYADSEDMAGLELLDPLSAPISPARFVPTTNLADQTVQAVGFPQGYPYQNVDGILASPVGGRLQIRINDPRFNNFIEQGFSGGPVMLADGSGLVGISVESDAEQIAYAIPTERLFEVWLDLREWSKPPVCPYKGLNFFREADRHLYFGREADVEYLLKVVPNQPFTAILGASGSGKSSLVFAGLIPHLRTHSDWTIATFRVSNSSRHDPFSALADGLVKGCWPEKSVAEQIKEAQAIADGLRVDPKALVDYLPDLLPGDVVFQSPQTNRSTPRLLLVADQFEELYTLCPDRALQNAFLQSLLVAVETAHTPLRLVITLRIDFLEQVLDSPLYELINKHNRMLGRLKLAQLRSIIEKPAHTVQVIPAPDMVARIVSDIGDEPGVLPLLEFALERWWQASNACLDHATYQQIGTVKGALAQHADEVYKNLSEEDRVRLRPIFRQLVQVSDAPEATSRRMTHRQLKQDWQLVQRLTDERLLVTDKNGEETTVEVAHEALLTHWNRLKGWIDADRAFLSWRRQLETDYTLWRTSGGQPTDLLQGSRLNAAQGWLEPYRKELEEKYLDFIQQSIEEHLVRQQRELEAERRLAEEQRQRAEEQTLAANRLSKQVKIVIVFGMIAFIFAIFAVFFYLNAQDNTRLAQTESQNARNAESTAIANANKAATAQLNAQTEAQNAQDAESTAVANANKAATAQAEAEKNATLAKKRNDEIEKEKQRIEAILNFPQTFDPSIRLNYLLMLLQINDPQAMKLFWGLPTKKEQLELFKTQNDQTILLIDALYFTMADVNRSGYTNDLLAVMLEVLETTPIQDAKTKALKTELEHWEQARTHIETEEYQLALEFYDKLIALNSNNLAVYYERAQILTELHQYDQALSDIERVLVLANSSNVIIDTSLDIRSDFSTRTQVIKSVRRLIQIKPELINTLNTSSSLYPNLKNINPIVASSPITDSKNVKMVLIPEGSFEMGSEMGDIDERPIHQVSLKSFYIDQYEVTNAQYNECVTDNRQCYNTGSSTSENASFPVSPVTWGQAVIYCRWRGARLPTEAEWEKAARGLDGRTYPWGEIISCKLANFAYCNGYKVEVGKYPWGVSPYGVHDMVGNVSEWTADWYDEEYYRYPGATENPVGPDDGSRNVLRGGSWINNANWTRITYRQSLSPDNYGSTIGFRCVMDTP